MLAPGTADSDGQVAFSFLNIMRNQIRQQPFDAFQELRGLRKGADVAANLGILSRVPAKPRHKVRVGKKAHVKNEIGIAGRPKAVSEADHGNEHGPLIGILEALDHKMAQLMHVELRSVDDDIGELANGLHERTLASQALANGNVLAQRVRTASLAISAQK